MRDKQVRYLYAAGAGIELVNCEDSSLSYPLHNHISVFTIGMILSGSVQITINGKKSNAVKNQAFIILPYAPHSISAKSKYTMLSLCVRKEAIEQINENQLVSMTAFLLNKAFEYKQIEQEQSLLFLDAVASCKRRSYKPAINIGFVQDLKQLIEQYPEYSFTADEMSNHTFVSKYHLIRSFKQEVGLTPHQFQIQNRVRKAQRLLNQPISITEVALTAGFFDQSHLIRCFEKIVGLTPSCYKSACQLIQM